jgi:hypothetical protein
MNNSDKINRVVFQENTGSIGITALPGVGVEEGVFVNWIHFALHENQWRVLVNTAIKVPNLFSVSL